MLVLISIIIVAKITVLFKARKQFEKHFEIIALSICILVPRTIWLDSVFCWRGSLLRKIGFLNDEGYDVIFCKYCRNVLTHILKFNVFQRRNLDIFRFKVANHLPKCIVINLPHLKRRWCNLKITQFSRSIRINQQCFWIYFSMVFSSYKYVFINSFERLTSFI